MPVTRQQLRDLLGEFPERPTNGYRTLESMELAEGTRHLVEFVSELANPLFNLPDEPMQAYLFIPNHDPGERLPAIVAIHQDGPRNDLGKATHLGLWGGVQPISK